MRTFIHHNGALGDTLLSLACLNRIRSDSSDVHIAGRRDVVEFLQRAGVVTSISSSDQALFASLHSDRPDDRVRQFLTRFDRIYIFTVQPESGLVLAVRQSIPGAQAIRTVPPAGSRTGAAEYRFSQLAPGARNLEDLSALDIPVHYAHHARQLLQKAGCDHSAGTPVALHPGSGGKDKRWALENFFAIADRLQSAMKAFVVLFSGPVEDQEFRRRIRRFVSGRTNMIHAEDVDLITAAALLTSCRLYIGNDSGFSHLAAASGCASLVLFGPTDPVLWKPAGRLVATIAAGPSRQISVESVFEKAIGLAGRGEM